MSKFQTQLIEKMSNKWLDIHLGPLTLEQLLLFLKSDVFFSFITFVTTGIDQQTQHEKQARSKIKKNCYKEIKKSHRYLDFLLPNSTHRKN